VGNLIVGKFIILSKKPEGEEGDDPAPRKKGIEGTAGFTGLPNCLPEVRVLKEKWTRKCGVMGT